MRGEKLKALLPGWQFDIVDTDIPFTQQNGIVRSLGFRYQVGPVIRSVNNFILDRLTPGKYDLVWVDKGFLITKATTTVLREKSVKLVHYTPDTAFYGNRSKMFYESMDIYDFLITTKNFELEDYRKKVAESKVIAATQGFDDEIHKPVTPFRDKQYRVAFVGLCEPSRETIIQYLIDHEIPVAVAGFKWNDCQKKNRGNRFFEFKGNSLWNKEYTSLISSSYFSLGLLSKRFPELHTTRTFEIPACGTALLTERNSETSSYFTDQEAIFYESPKDLVSKIRHYRQHTTELEQITKNGHQKVNDEGFDYRSILQRVISQVL